LKLQQELSLTCADTTGVDKRGRMSRLSGEHGRGLHADVRLSDAAYNNHVQVGGLLAALLAAQIHPEAAQDVLAALNMGADVDFEDPAQVRR